MVIKNKIIAKLISAILIATLALPSVAFASENNFKLQDESNSNLKNWTINVEYNQTRARRHADLVNQFRTSDTWIARADGTRMEIKGRNSLIYDYGLERYAMQRAAEIIFRFDHERPNGKMCDSLVPFTDDGGVLTYTGENIFYGWSSVPWKSEEVALEVLKEEDKSFIDQGHRRNMLSSDWKYIGVGHVVYNSKHYYVQWFSQDPIDLNYTEPLNSTKDVTVEVDTSLISDNPEDYENGSTVIPNDAIDENGNVHNPDDIASLYGNTIKSTYKTKTDISSLISTPGAVKTKYKSSNKKVAKVNKKGIVTGGKKAGTATITKYVKYDKKSPWEEAGSITIQNYYPKLPKKQTLSIGSTLSMNSLLTGMDETPIKWESSKPSVANVSENGMVIALQKGTAKLTPVFSSGKAKVKTTIKVK